MVSRNQISGDWFWEFSIPSTANDATRVVSEFAERATEWGASNDALLALQYGMHEALVNAVRHGNSGLDHKRVRVAYRFLGDSVWMEIEDEGHGFRILEVADPTSEELGRPGGRGLLLMRHFMSSVEYNEQGNRVTMQRDQARPRKVGLRGRRKKRPSSHQFANDDFQLI
jgi:serine/threonine-protein kinase RsbW